MRGWVGEEMRWGSYHADDVEQDVEYGRGVQDAGVVELAQQLHLSAKDIHIVRMLVLVLIGHWPAVMVF